MKKRQKLMISHWIFFRMGQLDEARLILRLLRTRRIRLEVDPVSMAVEEELKKVKVPIEYCTKKPTVAYAYLKEE